jgi:hypothetical protein
MRQCINAGGRRDVGWQTGHQGGVQRGHLGHHARVDDDQLLVVDRVGDDRCHGYFRASACSGGYGVNLDRGTQPLEVTRKLVQGFGVGHSHRNRFGGIHR